MDACKLGSYAVYRSIECFGSRRRRKYLTHAGAHRTDEEFGCVGCAKQNDCYARVVRGDMLYLIEFVRIAAHAFDDQQIRLLLFGDVTHLALSSFDLDD